MPTCYNCNKQVTKRDDANVLAFLGFVPRTFCNNCYSSKERGFVRHLFYFPKQPINSTIYKVGLWIATFVIAIISVFIFSSLFVNSGSSDSFIPVFVLIVLFLLVLLWQWILYFKAKEILAGLK